MSSIVKPPLGVLLNHGHPLSVGVVGCWLFNEGAGALGRVMDLSGNGNHGTLIGSAYSSPGKFGNAIHLETPAAPFSRVNLGRVFDGRDQLTVSWVSRLSDKDNTTGYMFAGDFPSVFASWWSNAHKYEVMIRDDSSDTHQVMTDRTYEDTEWHHFVVTYDGAFINIYVDGIIGDATPAAMTGPTFSAGPSDTYFGAAIENFSFKGDLDHVIVYNRGLSAGEVASLYAEPFQMFHREPIELWVGSVGAGAPPTVVPQIQYLRNMAAVA